MTRDLSVFGRLIQKLIARDRYLAEQNRPRRNGRSLESLEPRTLLATSSWDSSSNKLYIYGDNNQGEEIVVSKNGSNKVTITDNGTPVSISGEPYGGLDASAVDRIDVNTYGGGAETVDLSGVFASAGGFTSDLEGHVTITGGAYGDSIIGTGFGDSIIGGSGADSLSGNDGNDTLRGDTGNDTLIGGAGDDTHIFSGSDNLGCDDMPAPNSNENDTLDFSGFTYGGITLDLGSTGSCQSLSPALQLNIGSQSYGPQAVHVVGTNSADEIVGHQVFGDNYFKGGGGNDTLEGGGRDDTLEGGAGNDSLVGGFGNDTYRFTSNGILELDEVVEDAEGDSGDTLDFSNISVGYGATVNLSYGGFSQSIFSSGLQLKLSSGTSIERVAGTANGDTITGNSRSNTIWGGNGNDVIYGGDSDDTLYGEGGDDTLYGGGGTDSLDGGAGSNSLYQD